MAEKLQFDLVTPERLVLSEAVDLVSVPGAEGDFGVLAGHAPFMTTIRPGLIDVVSGGSHRKIFVYGGFADVSPAGLTILAEEAIAEADLDPAALDRAIREGEEDLALARDDAARAAAEGRLAHLRAAREAVGG
ncbi:MAG: F0F1 ATP synthase subunit epsilon [Alphaproteobacteria bacterium]|nr:F0F1 ATP synthase subunit epsilon [Alphaproteobacteria bacterium]